MNINEIYNMVQIIDKKNLSNLKLENKEIEKRLNGIYNFIKNIFNGYQNELEILANTTVRFCDFYDYDMLHGENIVEYFNANYMGKDKSELVNVFSLYVILKNSQELIYNYDLCESPEELYELLNINNYFEDLMTMIDFLQEQKLENIDENILDFLNSDNKYKILFTGYSYEDIKDLEKSTKKSLIKKLAGELSTSDIVSESEILEHLKGLYNFQVLRVHFAKDYRISYIRKNGVTAILGITLKTGKEDDYTRLAPLVRKKDDIYREIEMFSKGILPLNSEHYKTIEYLENFLKKENNKRKK